MHARSLGVPYHSWRITHAKHHAATAHLTQDQVFVPKTRSERKLPEFDPTQEDLAGSSVSEKVMGELWDALGDSPIGAVFGPASYVVGKDSLPARITTFLIRLQLFGWPLYLMLNASGQKRYPSNSNRQCPIA